MTTTAPQTHMLAGAQTRAYEHKLRAVNQRVVAGSIKPNQFGLYRDGQQYRWCITGTSHNVYTSKRFPTVHQAIDNAARTIR